jgi:hypothetical protein
VVAALERDDRALGLRPERAIGMDLEIALQDDDR